MNRRFTASRSRNPAFLLLALLPAWLLACGDAEPEPPQGPPVVTEQVAELSTSELMGMNRDLILATLPWREGTIRRTASENAAAGTQAGVEALTSDSFDRLILDFRSGAPAPGYRVWSPGREPVTLCGEEHTFEENGIVIQLTPALIRGDDGSMAMSRTEFALDLPVVTSVELACEGDREVAWLVQTVPERVEVRMLHLRNPERIALDIRAAAMGDEAGMMDEGGMTADTSGASAGH